MRLWQTSGGTQKSAPSSLAPAVPPAAGVVRPGLGQPAPAGKPFTLNPQHLGQLTQALLKTDTKAEYEQLRASIKATDSLLQQVNERLWYYQEHAVKCSKKCRFGLG